MTGTHVFTRSRGNVNDTDLQAPFGGWKLSGLGRELGPEGLRTYLEPRHLRMRVRPLA